MPRNQQKLKAREACAKAIRSGRLVRLACEKCGDPKTEAHHDDYSKPLAVRFLCKKHHRELHAGPFGLGFCSRGHALTPDNVYVVPDGTWRACRTCRSIRFAGKSGVRRPALPANFGFDPFPPHPSVVDFCKHGHPKTDSNITVHKQGHEVCRVCARIGRDKSRARAA